MSDDPKDWPRRPRIEPIPPPTPAQLRAFRRRYKIPQRTFAETFGVTRETVVRWETGAWPMENPVIARAMFWIESGFMPPEWLAAGIKDYRTAKARSAARRGSG